ncbi:hypothetical protein V6N13_005107 [Hibiscus sabdariffa]
MLTWYYRQIVVDRSDNSVGLLLLWSANVDVTLISYSNSHIDIEIKNVAHHFRFICMYSTTNHARKHEDWALIDNLRECSSLPWIFGGDLAFFVVMKRMEVFGN